MKPLSKTRFLRIRISLLIGVLLGVLLEVGACDVCGCAASGSGLGVLPRFDSGFLGIRYSYQGFSVPAVPGYAISGPGKDHYHRMELWSRILVNARLQLLVNLSYATHQRVLDEGPTTSISGPGDAQFLLNGALWRKENKNHSLQWNAAAGVRLPTGLYRQRDADGTMLPIGLQTGTGAYALPLATQFGYRRGAWGGMAEAAAVFSAENEETYKVGNQWTTALFALYYADLKRSFLIGNVALRTEGSARDREFGAELHNTGFVRTSVGFGADWYKNQWMLGVRGNVPIWDSAGSTQSRWMGGGSVQCVWFFGTAREAKRTPSKTEL
ncbi:hypothetical protein GC167_10290 [bacterium]|nr:hypothetical protein [bacterium]